MSDFHLSAEIPDDATPEEATQIRADAFKTALMHAATDPGIRAKMLAGEANAKIRMIPVESSYLAAVGYRPGSGDLHIEFKAGGQITHLGVPPEEHSALMAAPSHGKHYHARIKGVFKTSGTAPQQDALGAVDEAPRYVPKPRDTVSPRTLDDAIERFQGGNNG